MAYIHRQLSSLSGQQYHLHCHTQPQRPVILSPPVSDSSGSENETIQNKEQQQQILTSAWRLKNRQQAMTQAHARTQQQQQQLSNGDMAHATPKPNHFPTNENKGQNQNQVAQEKEWSTPAAMARNLLKSFGPPSSPNNRGRSNSVTTTTHTTQEVKRSLERAFAACEGGDPVKWTIQTLFEIGTRCAQLTKPMRRHEEDEKRVSQAVIDTFHTYRNRWIWHNASSIGNENGTKDHNNNSGSSNMNGRACSIEHTRGDADKKQIHNGDSDDLISLEESDEEREMENLNDYKQKSAQKSGHESHHKTDRFRPITQTHRQMLLDAILEGKSALQVFLSIDTFGLSDSLFMLPPMRGVKNDNISGGMEYENAESNGNGDQNTNGNEQQRGSGTDYGSLLAINLIQHDYLHAAIQMTSRLRDLRYHHHPNQQQNGDREIKEGQNDKGKDNVTLTSTQELLVSCLLDKGHPDLIHLFVNSDRELCRTILQTIDSRFAGQIWAWIEGEVVNSSLLDPFLVVQCRAQAPSRSPASSSRAPSAIYPLQMLFGMLEVANSLWMSFGLENTMKRFGSIQLIQEYCTVMSLLTNSRSSCHHSHRQTHYKQKLRANHAPENAFNLTPWMFIPSALPVLKQNPALQRLVVWTFAMCEDGVATAEFLASVFNLRAFFAQCVRHTSKEDGDDDQYRDGEKNDQVCRDGGAKTTLLLEQPLTRVQGQSVDQNSNYEEGSPKGKEKYSLNYEKERTVLNQENKNKDLEAHNPSEFYKSAGPLLSASIAQMSVSDVTDNHYTNYNNTLPPLAVDLQNTFTQATLSSLQTKPSSAPTSTSAFTKTPPLKQKKPLLIHRPHTTASVSIPKTQLLCSRHMQMLDYKPSPETTIILLNQMSQLQQLFHSLLNSNVVGMSLIQPLAKPWANFRHHPDKAQQMQLLQQHQQQLLRQQERQQGAKNKKRGGTGTGERECAYLQLACSSDKRVYVIDLEVFLNEETDPMHKFPRLLGEIFFNPSICKLAYNWKEEITYLRTLFPLLKDRRHHIDNLFDFYYIWIVPNPNPQLPNQNSSNTSNKWITAWYCGGGQPIFPTRMSQPKFKNVSGLLFKVMGRFLKRTSKLGWDAWIVKPLPVCLQQDLAMSALCLLDMFAVLDRDGQRMEREETAQFMIHAAAK